MLRLIFVSLIIVFGGLAALQGPFHALLFYLWYAYFRPEQWVWTYVLYTMPISLIAGIWLLVSSVFALPNFKWSTQVVLILLMFAQSTLSLVTSEHQDWSFGYWLEFLKVLTVAVLMTFLISDRRRYRLTLLVIGYSLALEAAKQGWAQMLLNPGALNRNSHPVLGDNNGVAVGMMMLIPIFSALSQTAQHRWERWLHQFFIVGLLYRGLSTYSRGGFLAAVVMGAMMLWNSPRKLRMVVAATVVTLAVSSVMPNPFWARMRTITTDEASQDGSSKGRLLFWETSLRMAEARPLTGVGFNGFSQSFSRYDPSHGLYGEMRAVHSAWFGILADLGYPGLVLFLAVMWTAFRSCRRVRKAAREFPARSDLGLYANALQTSLMAYIVGATFLNGQYNEMFWHLIGLSAALETLSTAPQPSAAVVPATPTPRFAPRVETARTIV